MSPLTLFKVGVVSTLYGSRTKQKKWTAHSIWCEPAQISWKHFTGHTVPIDRILSVKNARAWVSMDFT